jgi:hypothetical protein
MRAFIISIALSLVCFPILTHAQISKRHGLRTMGTLSPGYMFGLKEGVVSLSGSWSFYLNEHISVHGEGSYFLTSLEEFSRVSDNSSLLGGLNYHFTANKRFDPFIGMQPGAGFFTREGGQLVSYKLEVVPLISFIGGVNYYVGSFFNFFVHLRYLQGQAINNPEFKSSLSEIRLMAGLGFNLGVK